jgi:hypothetical protein
MGELVNLRRARKKAAAKEKERTAAQNRLAHGHSKAARSLEAARAQKTQRELDAHRIEGGKSDEVSGG